jgi:hypothetical protein
MLIASRAPMKGTPQFAPGSRIRQFCTIIGLPLVPGWASSPATGDLAETIEINRELEPEQSFGSSWTFWRGGR